MTIPAYTYQQSAEHYIDVIERDSPQAAVVLRALQATVGARAALRVALVLMGVKADLAAHPSRRNFQALDCLFLNAPEARAGFEQALAYCLHAWKVRVPASTLPATTVSRLNHAVYP